MSRTYSSSDSLDDCSDEPNTVGTLDCGHEDYYSSLCATNELQCPGPSGTTGTGVYLANYYNIARDNLFLTPITATVETTLCAGLAPDYQGDEASDSFGATDLGEVYELADGYDSASAGAGADTICGGWGKDFVHGHKGADEVRGGAGDDELHGDGSNDASSATPVTMPFTTAMAVTRSTVELIATSSSNVPTIRPIRFPAWKRSIGMRAIVKSRRTNPPWSEKGNNASSVDARGDFQCVRG